MDRSESKRGGAESECAHETMTQTAHTNLSQEAVGTLWIDGQEMSIEREYLISVLGGGGE